MHDGPYRTLRLPKHWKEVARRAELRSCQPDEVAKHMRYALVLAAGKNRLRQITRRLRSCSDPATIIELEPKLFDGIEFGGTIRRYLFLYLCDSVQPRYAVTKALRDALLEHAEKMCLGIAAHHESANGFSHAQIRKRLRNARALIDMQRLAEKLLGLRHYGLELKRPKRQLGLEDGPRLARIASKPVIE